MTVLSFVIFVAPHGHRPDDSQKGGVVDHPFFIEELLPLCPPLSLHGGPFRLIIDRSQFVKHGMLDVRRKFDYFAKQVFH